MILARLMIESLRPRATGPGDLTCESLPILLSWWWTQRARCTTRRRLTKGSEQVNHRRQASSASSSGRSVYNRRGASPPRPSPSRRRGGCGQMNGDQPGAFGPLRVAARGGLRSGGPLPRAILWRAFSATVRQGLAVAGMAVGKGKTVAMTWDRQDRSPLMTLTSTLHWQGAGLGGGGRSFELCVHAPLRWHMASHGGGDPGVSPRSTDRDRLRAGAAAEIRALRPPLAAQDMLVFELSSRGEGAESNAVASTQVSSGQAIASARTVIVWNLPGGSV